MNKFYNSNIAAIFCLISALIDIVMEYNQSRLIEYPITSLALFWLTFVMFVYYMLTLRMLLSKKYGFSKTDLFIYGLIAINIFGVVISLLTDSFFIYQIILICTGLVRIAFSITFFVWKSKYSNLIKTYCLFSIVYGILSASIIFISYTTYIGIILELLLAAILILLGRIDQTSKQQTINATA